MEDIIHLFPFYLGIIVLIILLILVAEKIKVAYPILLVIGGLLLCFIPGIPHIRIDPELIFIIFLPPLLYEAAWSISWKELWKWRRIISSFAFIVVLLTATIVAFVANHFIPGFSLALGFLLGGVVSPPDAVSAGAIMKFVKVPTRFKSIIEGESLFNDASSLIVFRFALIAIATGQFIWQDAIVGFAWTIAAGIGIGLLVAFIFYKAHRWLPTSTEMDICLTLLAPYFMYIAAEAAHSSGVMAVVVGGLFLANRKYKFLTNSSRIKAYSVWESLCFILNGLVFILIGLDLPQIIEGLEGVSMNMAISYALLITAVLIVSRIFAAYGAVVITLIARRFIKVADDRHPGLKAPFLLGWAGMRGVVSLAAALSIPLYLKDGSPFPQRNLILFITFIVILVTLILQGLTLPYFIKKINILRDDEKLPDESHYHHLQKRLHKETKTYIREAYSTNITLKSVIEKIEEKWSKDEEGTHLLSSIPNGKEIMLDIINKQRDWLHEWNKDIDVEEDYIRKHLFRLDIEEERLKYL